LGSGIYYQGGTVTIRGSALVHNTAGDAIFGLGILTIDHSTISENRTGGINTGFSFLQLTDSTVADNIGGPGIFSLLFQIERSTISGNFDPNGVGGGISQNGGPGVGLIDNSTISDNTAVLGGGVVVGAVDSRITITHCTILNNHAIGTRTIDGGGGIYIAGNGPGSFGLLFIGQSIVAGNDSAAPFTGQDVDGPVVSLHSNFIGNGDFSDGWVTTGRTMDHVGTTDAPLDAMLGPLQDNGGPTLTRAPLPGSPVLDVFDGDHSPDQRGSFRVGFTIAPGAVATNPAAAFRVAAPSVVAPGQPFQITVTAVDLWGNTASTYHGTVHFSSTDLDAQLPDNYTFATADGGAHTFDAALQTTGLQTI
jgi:hypothetical protein